VPDDPGDDREMEKCCGRSQATAPPETPSAKHGVFLLNRGSNKLHLILDKKLAAFNTNYLDIPGISWLPKLQHLAET
jgi:hypothetical protein